MIALFKKEVNSFFSSPIGYLVIGVFLLLNGLFLFLFKGDYNLLDNGIASLSSFFLLAPWILMFLVPAITMRSFSDDKKQGTLELLLTKPISPFYIVIGKYLGSLSLIILALLPTLLYALTLFQLGNPTGNLDVGSTVGAYLGLLFLAASFTAIGIYTSALTSSQIVAFILGVFICFIIFFGFEGLASLKGVSQFLDVEKLGMISHYRSISRGVIDTRDLIYFFSIALIFIVLTKVNITSK
jgi:ABC-2 type transport system permease protein